jgi:hypothetical protein
VPEASAVPRWRRWTDRWQRFVVVAAGTAGATLRGVPGAGGALAISYGLAQIYPPLGWIAAGVALVLLDRRVP